MPDQDLDDDDQNTEGNDEQFVRLSRADIRRLEKRAKTNDALESSNLELARKLAFFEAGVDISSPTGKLLLKSWDADNDVDAIKAAAQEIGALTGGAPPKADDQEIPPDEKGSTDERGRLGDGAPADQFRLETPDPRTAAVEKGLSALKAGSSEEDAIGMAFEHMARAAEAGDKRVLWDPNAERTR